MKVLCAIVVVISVISGDGQGVQTERDARRVQEDVKSLVDALYGGDVETVLRFTHPKIIAMLGGKATSRKAVEDAVLTLRNAGMRLESLAFPKPPEFLAGGGRRFAVVPTLSIISARGQRIESLNFQLGILEPGSTDWTYVEGSRIADQNVQTLFPGFPTGYEFPPFYRKKL